MVSYCQIVFFMRSFFHLKVKINLKSIDTQKKGKTSSNWQFLTPVMFKIRQIHQRFKEFLNFRQYTDICSLAIQLNEWFTRLTKLQKFWNNFGKYYGKISSFILKSSTLLHHFLSFLIQAVCRTSVTKVIASLTIKSLCDTVKKAVPNHLMSSKFTILIILYTNTFK